MFINNGNTIPGCLLGEAFEDGLAEAKVERAAALAGSFNVGCF